MYLGLDLRGGVHFLMQVDMRRALSKRLDALVGDLRTLLREKQRPPRRHLPRGDAHRDPLPRCATRASGPRRSPTPTGELVLREDGSGERPAAGRDADPDRRARRWPTSR
jgi:preprotein translocase subunit SecD